MIRQATLDDLDNTDLYVLATRFFAESQIPGTFIPSVFRAYWREFISKNTGVIFLVIQDNEICGAIGGVSSPDICNGQIVVQEMFWFVKPLARGKVSSLKLYDALERWSKAIGAVRLQMSCIGNMHTAQVRKFYERKGLKAKEISFFKTL